MDLILFFIPMLLSLVVTLTYGVISYKKTKDLSWSIVKSILGSFLMLMIATIWWFNYESDGLSQIFGMMYYFIAFVIISLINAIAIRAIKKKQRT